MPWNGGLLKGGPSGTDLSQGGRHEFGVAREVEARHVLASEKELVVMAEVDLATRTELEAAAFRRLVQHLRERTDVQNIDLMNLAGFCRNCLSRWYREAAEAKGIGLSDPEAREIIYGMPYREWQAKYQKETTPEQQAAFATANKGH